MANGERRDTPWWGWREEEECPLVGLEIGGGMPPGGAGERRRDAPCWDWREEEGCPLVELGVSWLVGKGTQGMG